MQIIDGQVVQTVQTDLRQFIAQKQAELATISRHVNHLTARQAAVVAELESLVV